MIQHCAGRSSSAAEIERARWHMRFPRSRLRSGTSPASWRRCRSRRCWAVRRALTAYASLLRYAEPELVTSAIDRALAQGFRHLKLHEVRSRRRQWGESSRRARALNSPASSSSAASKWWLRPRSWRVRMASTMCRIASTSARASWRASARSGIRARSRLRALLRRPGSQPLPRRGARSRGAPVGTAWIGVGARSGHGVIHRYRLGGALDADFAIDVVGTMMCAYGVPFHITHGPPLVQSVGYASS